jgi:tubulin polyglutamylase TTLL6/13
MSIGHKRSLTSVFELLSKQGLDVKLLQNQIKDILIKTFISGLPLIRHQYRSCQLENYAGNMCFEVLGFDVILTSKGEPYLLEVNHTPSFTTDTPLDELIKKNLIRDSLVLMNINTTSKAEIIAAKREELNNRVYAGKKIKLTQEERENFRVEAQK